jgi:hypothetical protein
MADNANISNVIVATDEIVGVHYQKVKLDIGADNETSPVTTDNRLPVDATPSVPVANDYLPVRLTDGTAFYSASGGGGGTATLTEQQTQTTHLSAIQVATQILDNAIAGSEMQVDVITSALPTGASTSANQTAQTTLFGAVAETAPATDIASSGLNGRLQRVAQRITSLIAQLPASLGQKTSAASLAVTVASDQTAVPVSGTVTANAGTGPFPVSDDGGSLTIDGSVSATTYMSIVQPSAAFSAATISAAADLGGRAVIGISLPSTWATGDLSFQVSTDNVNFYPLYDLANAQVKVTAAAASRAYGLIDAAAAWRYIKVVSSVSQTATVTFAAKG